MFSSLSKKQTLCEQVCISCQKRSVQQKYGIETPISLDPKILSFSPNKYKTIA